MSDAGESFLTTAFFTFLWERHRGAQSGRRQVNEVLPLNLKLFSVSQCLCGILTFIRIQRHIKMEKGSSPN
jgi:hypothetical protein